MLGSRLDALECQAGPEGSGGAQVTIRSVQAPHGVETEEPGGLLDHLVPHGCPGDVTLGIGSRLQQQDLAFRCLQTTGQGSERVRLGATGLGGPLTCFGCSVPQSVRLFVTPWTAARQASLPIDNSWSSLKLTSIEKGKTTLKGQMSATQKQSCSDQHLTLYNTLTNFYTSFMFTSTKRQRTSKNRSNCIVNYIQ